MDFNATGALPAAEGPAKRSGAGWPSAQTEGVSLSCLNADLLYAFPSGGPNARRNAQRTFLSEIGPAGPRQVAERSEVG